MAALKWLDGYSGQTTDELITLEGIYRTDSLVCAFEQAIYQKSKRVGSDCLTMEERVVLAVEALEREVNNGGYSQFFINSSIQYTSIIVDALKQIECSEVAVLTQQAIDILEIKGPITAASVDERFEEDKALEDKLHECDKEYYKIAGDLSAPLLNYINNNREKIILDGQVSKPEKKPWWKFL